jgi:hypothetical protein
MFWLLGRPATTGIQLPILRASKLVLLPNTSVKMGNKNSKHQSPPIAGLSISGPTAHQIHIPRNRADPDGLPIQQTSKEMNRGTLEAGLQYMSDYIASKPGAPKVTVPVVGGVVNTLYLRTRPSTHDVDVFGSDLSNAQRVLLDEAMYQAQKHVPGLGTDWFNTETQMWMTGPVHADLTKSSQDRGVCVFEGKGLALYAAPWEYAFSAKVSRVVAGEHERPYDVDDAVGYIRQYIVSRGGNRPVQVKEALEWARKWGHRTDEKLLRGKVNQMYVKKYNAGPAFV